MSTLSLHRLRLYAQYDLATNYRSLAVILGSMVMLLGIVQLFCFHGYIMRDAVPGSAEAQDSLTFYKGVYYIWALIIFSFFQNYMLTRIQKGALKKQERLQMLVLPVSMLEKFIVRLVHAAFYFLVLAVLALFFADLFRMLLEPLLGDYRVGFTIHEALYKGWHLLWYEVKVPPFLAIYVSSLGFSLVGGCLFRRHPFIFTILLSQVISFLFVIGAFLWVATFGADFFEHHGLDIVFTPLSAKLLHYTFFSLLTALEVYIAYRLFSRQQLLGRSLIIV